MISFSVFWDIIFLPFHGSNAYSSYSAKMLEALTLGQTNKLLTNLPHFASLLYITGLLR
jgi:hypothetical protein